MFSFDPLVQTSAAFPKQGFPPGMFERGGPKMGRGSGGPPQGENKFRVLNFSA